MTMTPGWRDRSLGDLLGSRDLRLALERPFPTDGWSGATFSGMEDPNGRRFVLKRTSLAIDWIARATNDESLREGWLASLSEGAPANSLPYLGAAADGDGVAILMPDLSNELIAWERPGHDPVLDGETLDRVVRSMTRLHALPWGETLEADLARTGGSPPPWCPLDARLRLLSPSAAMGYAADGNTVGDRFLEGWAAFRRQAPPAAMDLVNRLDRDVTPLTDALAALPSRGLHGDMKLANVALLSDDRVGLIDWQMTLRAPVAVELGWFLVSNSGSLPDPPEAVLDAYATALRWDSGRWGLDDEPNDFDGLVGDWEAQVDLIWIVGLFLRGWRKGLDAEADITLASGVTARDDLAWWCAIALEAAERRL
jgi:thiamine kinase-like enzyme